MLSKFTIRSRKSKQSSVIWVRARVGELDGSWVKSKNPAHGSLKINGTSGIWRMNLSKVFAFYIPKKKTPIVVIDPVPLVFYDCGEKSSGEGSILFPDSYTEAVAIEWKCDGGICF